jgi:hypothetical protein
MHDLNYVVNSYDLERLVLDENTNEFDRRCLQHRYFIGKRSDA